MDATAKIKYPNLRAEMSRNGIKQIDIAKVLGVSKIAVYQKMNGKSRFTIDEAFLIKEKFFPDLSLDYLFFNNN